MVEQGDEVVDGAHQMADELNDMATVAGRIAQPRWTVIRRVIPEPLARERASHQGSFSRLAQR